MINLFLKYFALALALLLLSTFATAQEQNTALIKIKVDVEGVTILLNEDSLLVDSYGSPLLAEAWFVLNLLPGEYQFSFLHPDYDTQIRELTVEQAEIATIEVRFLPEDVPPIDSASITAITTRVSLSSVPLEAMIMLDGKMLEDETPAYIKVGSGAHDIEVLKDGWEPLTHTVRINSSNAIVLNYILMPMPPANSAPEALGLQYRDKLIPLDARGAEKLRATFNSLTETFAILPLGQGLVAKAFLQGEQDKTADLLIASGVVLTAGAYILGRVLYKKRLNKISTRNAEIGQINLEFDELNKMVDQAIEEHDGKLLEIWLNENQGKGKVEVQYITDSLLLSPPR